MKAIYINLDPYLAAFAAWLKGGKSGPKPYFDPLPLAVTIPLGEEVVLLSQSDIYAGEDNVYTIDGQSVEVAFSGATGVVNPGDDDSAIARHFSRFAASAEKYYPIQLTSDSPTLTLDISGVGGGNADAITFTVLVRRETASGPVDLVDFTPPASAIAAGTDLKGATFDGNEIVAAETTGALSAPAGA